jgi:CHAD domain
VKARKVKGLDPAAPLRVNASLILHTRLDEMRGFAPRALAPEGVEDRHEMRIAAKRLRYVLELTGECFGEAAENARKEAKTLQAVLGDIHDCDMMIPRVQAQIETLRARDTLALLARADGAPDLDPGLLASAPNRVAYRGLDLLVVHLEARRSLLFERFGGRWRRQEDGGVWRALERAL